MFFSFIELNYFDLRLSVSYRPANWYVLQQITFAIQKKNLFNDFLFLNSWGSTANLYFKIYCITKIIKT